MQVKFVTAAAAALAACVHAIPSGTFQLGLRTLVLYSGYSELQIARVVIGGHGAPYDAHPYDKIPQLDTPTWHSVVIVTCNSDNLAKARSYSSATGARIACLYTADGSLLSEIGIGTTEQQSNTRVAFDSSEDSLKVADVMNEKGAWAISENQMPIAYTLGNGAKVIPFLRYTDATAGPVSEGGVAAVVVQTTANTFEMHFAFHAGAHDLCREGAPCLYDLANKPLHGNFTKLTMALGNVWFQWVTRGVYLGQRRVFLQMHIDDYFAESAMVDGTKVRIGYEDVAKAAEWVKGAPAKHGLPTGSQLTLEWAFNGFGHSSVDMDTWPAYASDKGLKQATEDFLGDFNWVSHTYSHQHMDWLGPWQCNGSEWTCPTPRQRNYEELLYNLNLALGKEVPEIYGGENDTMWYYDMGGVSAGRYMFHNKDALAQKRFSPHCLVTPEVSGIAPAWIVDVPEKTAFRPANQDALVPMKQLGIQTVVGDNSRPELQSTVSVHHGFNMTLDSHGIEGIMIIPRAATSTAYSVSNVDQWLDWYNTYDGCSGDFGPECKEGTNYTYEEAMGRNEAIGVFYLLQYRADAFMFHQANVKFFDFHGQQSSLVTLWADSVLRDFTTYINKLPITSPRMEDAAEHYRQRMVRDYCQPVGSVKVVDGAWEQIDLSSTRSCTALLSVGKHSGVEVDSANKETYGVDTTHKVLLDAVKSRTLAVSGLQVTELQPAATGGAHVLRSRALGALVAGLLVVVLCMV